MMITGTGCALMDYLYNHVDFSSEAFRRSCSRSPGDGGLSPGGLVFADELQQFTGKSSAELLQKIVGDRPPDGENLGGPAVVALVHAAQLLRPSNIPVAFHGARGNDGGGRKMLEILRSTPLRVNDLIIKDGPTPSTVVLSDPTYREGRGERTFINTVGAADNYTADDLDDSFFKGNINLFGGTALLPGLHDSLLPVLRKSKRHESITVVATVYDFRNEKKAPNRPWPLGESTETYSSVDLLIVDQEEAIRLSGQASPEQAAAQFTDWGVGALIITQGADAILVQSQGKLFAPLPPTWLEVCKAADRDLEIQPEKRGDTTG